MIHTVLVATFLLPLVHSKNSSQLCSGTAEESPGGNWYCSEVTAITYRNISQSGAYNQTISIDPNTGLCGHQRLAYPGTGPLTPLYGEVSMHLRGPLNVSQLAVYEILGAPDATKQKRELPFHNRQTASEPGRAQPAPDSTSYGPLWKGYPDTGSPSDHNLPGADSIKSKRDTSGAIWTRTGYYNSIAPAQTTGLSFLANLGDPQKSGTFDYAFGNSLSYVTPDGGTVASESLPFSGNLATSEYEIAVFSNKTCDVGCQYSRPKSVSHYGWSGSSKAFFIEFQMDHYQNRGSDQGLISDSPAWWFLNAAIPRILQYGSDRNNTPCSCWATGCGEFDAFEILEKGEERAKSTLHRQGNLEGGDSNYFKRPVGMTLKFAVIWHFPHITALVLDDDFNFTTSFTDQQIQNLVSYDPDSWVHSLFAIGP